MDIKLSEVKRLILESLQPIEEKYGYKISKSQFSLIKKEKERTSALSFTENHWFDEVQLIPSIYVDVKEIQDIWKKFDQYTGYTFLCNLRKLSHWYDDFTSWDDFKTDNADRYQVFIYNNDIQNTSNDIQILFEKYGLRYTEEYATISGVHKLLNSDPENEATSTKRESAWWHTPGFHVQSTVGLIAAKLVDDGSYNIIAEIYSKRLEQRRKEKSMYEEDINLFFKIKEYLG